MSIKQVQRYIFRTKASTYQVRIDRRGSNQGSFIKIFKELHHAFEAAATFLMSLNELDNKKEVIELLKTLPPESGPHSVAEMLDAPTLSVAQQHELEQVTALVNRYIYVYALANKQLRFKVVIGVRGKYKAYVRVYKEHKEAFYSAAFALQERGEPLPYDMLIANVKNIYFKT